MTPEPVLVALLSKAADVILPSLSEKVFASDEWKKATQAAIRLTQERFDSRPLIVEDALRSWTQGNTFQGILLDMKKGTGSTPNDVILKSFIEEGQLDPPPGTVLERLAVEVISSFAENLHQELLKSPLAPAVLSGQMVAIARQQEQATNRMGARIESRLDAMAARLDRHHVALPGPSAIEDSTARKVDGEDEGRWNGKVDAARQLMEKGRYKSARTILVAVREEISSRSPSEYLRFRVSTNLGNCALNRGDAQAALAEYEEAARLRPAHPTALSNKALGLMVAGNPEQAFALIDHAMGLGSKEPNVVACYVQICGRTGRFELAEKAIAENDWCANNPGVVGVLADMNYRAERYPVAEDYARRALQLDADDPMVWELLALAVIAPIQQRLLKDPPLLGQLPSDDRTRVEEAEAALSKAVDILRATEREGQLLEVLENRIGVYVMLGMRDEAARDCDEILALRPGQVSVLMKKVGILASSGQLEGAFALVEGAMKGKSQTVPNKMQVQLLLDLGRLDRALAVLQPWWAARKTGERPDLELTEVYVGVLLKLGQADGAQEVVDVLEKEYEVHPLTAVFRGRIAVRQGDKERALVDLSRAVEASAGNLRSHINAERADLLYVMKRYAEAADIYVLLADTKTANALTERCVFALYLAGRHKEALALAQKLRGTAPAIRSVSKVEAAILEDIGDLEAARKLWLELADLERDDKSHSIRAAWNSIRLGEQELARKIVGGISIPSLRDDWDDLIRLAELRQMLGLDGVLEAAFQARRKGFGEEGVHLAYVNLFLRQERLEGELKQPLRVDSHSGVRLKSEEGALSYLLVDSEDADPGRGELGPSNAVFRALLGKGKGDSVLVGEGTLQPRRCRIVAITNRYVYAFQDTLAHFEDRFPGSAQLQKMTMKKGDYSKFMAVVEHRFQFTESVEKLYRERGLPLHFFAGLVGSSVIEVWATLINRNGSVLRCATGNEEEQSSEVEALRGASELVVDQTALLSFALLGMLEQLAAFRKILVAAPALDALAYALMRFPEPGQKAGQIYKGTDGLHMHEATVEETMANRQFIQALIDWIRAQASVIPIPAVLDVEKGLADDWAERLGEAGWSSIMAAKGRGVPMLSDDLGLRQLARGSWGVTGASTLGVLKEMKEAGMCDEAAYFAALRKLIAAHYVYVGVDGKYLAWLYKEATYDISEDLVRAFRTLEGPTCTEKSAVIVAAALLKELLSASDLEHQRAMLMDLVLKSVTAGRDSQAALRRLLQTLAVALKLVPFDLERAKRQIAGWMAKSLIVRRGREFGDLLR